MSNVIEWQTATEIIEYLKSQNALVSGMSVAEAAAALGFTKTASGIYVKTVITTALKAVVGTTASSVAPVAGAAATTTTATNLVLFETAAGTAQVGGLASLALPVAATVLAATGGYLIGNEIYKENSDFLDKLMFPLYDFISGNNIAEELYQDDTPVGFAITGMVVAPAIPMIFNQYGEAFMDSRAYYGVTQFLDVRKSYIAPATTIESFRAVMGHGDSMYNSMYTNQTEVDRIIGLTTREVVYLNVKIYPTSYQSTRAYLYTLPPSYYIDNILAYWDVDGSIRGYTKEGVMSPNSGDSRCPLELWEIGYNDYSRLCLAERKVLNDYISPIDRQLILSKGMVIYESIEAYLNGELPTISQELGLPPSIIPYTHGALGSPLSFPDAVPDWIPITVPELLPDKLPSPVEYPDIDPYPEKITPFITPYQPLPITIPIKKPTTQPVIPIIPVPNGIPDTSTASYPKPDATVDPSQLPESNPVAQQVPTSDPIITDTVTTPPAVLPFIPPIASSDKGLLHVYNPTNLQINEFGAWLWTTFSGDLLETLSKMFNNPMDAVIGLHELYATPITTSEETTIKAGYLDSGVASRLVSTRYSEIKCGALAVPEFWGNYLDYAPYTKTFCYLPFIGMVELNTDDIVGSGVEITYKIDSYNGSCIAIITTSKTGSEESITYQFAGNCSVEIPITSGMKSAVQSALIGAATTALAASVGGGAALAGMALAGGVRQGGNSKNMVQHSGSFGSSYGAMGLKLPFILVKRPKQKVVAGYNTNYGYPAHKMVRISSCSGYLKVIEVDVVSPTATENEKKMIEKELKNGVFVS